MSQQQLFPTLPEDIALNTPNHDQRCDLHRVLQGTPSQVGSDAGQNIQVAISRGAVSRPFDFFCQEVEQFPILAVRRDSRLRPSYTS